MLGDHVDLVGLHDLGDHGQPRGLARLVQELEPFLLEPLEGVGRGPRFEGPAAQDVRPAGLDALGHGQELRARLDGAGPGHDHELLAADGHPVDPELRRFRVRLAARQLEGLENPDHVLHALQGLQGQELLLGAVVAHHADDGAFLAAREMRLEAQVPHPA